MLALHLLCARSALCSCSCYALAQRHTLRLTLRYMTRNSCGVAGTPTPASAALDVKVAYLEPLLRFLRLPPLCLLSGTPAWKAAVDRPFRERRVEGRGALMALLRRTLVRASKAELRGLAALDRRVVLLDFAPSHASSYNSFVQIIEVSRVTPGTSGCGSPSC